MDRNMNLTMNPEINLNPNLDFKRCTYVEYNFTDTLILGFVLIKTKKSELEPDH